jgi:predicted DNA-binding transcriptional regulator YafY
MNRIDRLTAILIQLQTKRWITASEIADRYEISHRTVYRDMRALEEAGVPIGSEAGKGYFIVEGYHLPPVMFTREEAGAMLIAGKLVDKLTDDSVRKGYLSATDKIKSILPETDKSVLEDINDQVEVFYSRQRSGEGYPDNFLITVQKALGQGKCLKIDYHAQYNQKKTSGRIIDPLGLVFYGNAWHILGYCKLRNEMRDFRVDRILHLEITTESASEKKPGSLKKYFQNLWLDSDLFEVKVWFDQSLLASLNASKYYFGFIDEYPDNEGMVMSFAVNEYSYIAHWLLSFGEKVRIIHPMELQDKMVEQVQKLSKIYLRRNE